MSITERAVSEIPNHHISNRSEIDNGRVDMELDLKVLRTDLPRIFNTRLRMNKYIYSAMKSSLAVLNNLRRITKGMNK